MQIVISGGTGFIGRALAVALHEHGHHLTLLTRGNALVPASLRAVGTLVEWNGRDTGPWEACLEGAEAVINLAGAPIAEARWTPARKQLLLNSRVLPTRLLVDALSRCTMKPQTLINASGIGYYGATDAQTLDETAPHGEGFLPNLCRQWEAEARRADACGIRVVSLRTGMVLEHDGGALPKMLVPFQFFVGGPIMPGTQWVSWIHRDDHIGLIEWLLTTPALTGPINAVAPGAVTMQQFCQTLGDVLRRPSWLPVPSLALQLALGELSTLMTTGQHVQPKKALAGGYTFAYPTLAPALHAIITRTPMKPPPSAS